MRRKLESIDEQAYVASHEPEPFEPVSDLEKMWAAGLLVPSHMFDLGFEQGYRAKLDWKFHQINMTEVKADTSRFLEDKVIEP